MMETYQVNDSVDVPNVSQTGTTNTDHVLKTIEEVAKHAVRGVTTAITCQKESLFSDTVVDVLLASASCYRASIVLRAL